MASEVGQLAHPTVPGSAHAARLGMWVFLGTEVLLFGVLFAGYAVYRHLYGAAFAECSHHLDRTLGTVDTIILITSSLTMALSLPLVRARERRLALIAIGATVALGIGFLCVHGHEYWTDIHAGALPGRLYHAEVTLPGAGLFYTLYYFMTGLHSIHVLFGVSLLTWLGLKVARDNDLPKTETPLEMGGLYWHLIDLIWIFLYPLLYLI